MPNNEITAAIEMILDSKQLIDALADRMAADPNIIAKFNRNMIAAPSFVPALRTVLTTLARTVPSLFGSTGNPPKGSTAKSSGR